MLFGDCSNMVIPSASKIRKKRHGDPCDDQSTWDREPQAE